MTWTPKLTPTLVKALSRDPECRRRQLLWLERYGEAKSHQRRAEAFHYLALGFADVFVVAHVTRLSPSITSVRTRAREHTVEIRPAKSGKWGRAVEVRAVRDAAESSRLEEGEASVELRLAAHRIAHCDGLDAVYPSIVEHGLSVSP